MRQLISTACVIIATTCLFFACENKEQEVVVVQDITITDVRPEEKFVEPPPPPVVKKFGNLQDWLLNLCNSANPEIPDPVYTFRMFKVKDQYAVYMVLVKKATNDPVKFEDVSMTGTAYTFPETYNQLTKAEVLSKVAPLITGPMKTKQFASCSLKKSKMVMLTFDNSDIRILNIK